MTSPTPPAAGGSGLNRKVGGVPAWGWGLLVVGAGVGVWLWIRNRNAKAASSTATTQDVTSSGGGSEAGTAEYEQLHGELTDLQARDAALLAAIHDLQGHKSKCPHGYDWDGRKKACVRICPDGYRWDETEKRCVRRERKRMSTTGKGGGNNQPGNRSGVGSSSGSARSRLASRAKSATARRKQAPPTRKGGK